ncbi:MAG TPA: glycosyltransferase family A protein [Propionibacteriaceae bacterium]|nr:glycosyltransferase family A protein [Propionibacteriaceae bacterium]
MVIPAFNEADYLPATLRSLQAQDFSGGFEVIVVDNGSTDGTADLARRLGARVVEERTPGVCAARQRGTLAVRGEIVVSTDADTVHPREWLSRLDVRFAAEPAVVAVAGPCRYADPPWWAAVVPPLWFAALAALHDRLGHVGYITATNVAFRRVGFPGYDVRLTQGGDEADLLRRLRRWGRVVWDADNAVTTSSRRMEQGLAHTLVVSYGFYYASSLALNRRFARMLVGRAPAIRQAEGSQVRRVRRRWRLALLTGTALAVSVRARRRSSAPRSAGGTRADG